MFINQINRDIFNEIVNRVQKDIKDEETKTYLLKLLKLQNIKECEHIYNQMNYSRREEGKEFSMWELCSGMSDSKGESYKRRYKLKSLCCYFREVASDTHPMKIYAGYRSLSYGADINLRMFLITLRAFMEDPNFVKFISYYLFWCLYKIKDMTIFEKIMNHNEWCFKPYLKKACETSPKYRTDTIVIWHDTYWLCDKLLVNKYNKYQSV